MSSFVPWTRFPRAAPLDAWSVQRRERLLHPPERVWTALTEVRQLTQWWCDEAIVDLRPGGVFAFAGSSVLGGPARLGDTCSADAVGSLVEAVPPERLVVRWSLLGVDTTVTIELENCMEMTEITVTQVAGRAVGWGLEEELESWWAPALSALRAYLDKGRPDLRLDFVRLATQPSIDLSVNVTTFPWLIWDKLTQARELRRWWSRSAELACEPGGAFRLGERRFGPQRCLVVEPEGRFVHDWTWFADKPSPVEWRIEERESDVRVSVSDGGPWPAELPPSAVAIHWAARLLALQQMSEKGTSHLEA